MKPGQSNNSLNGNSNCRQTGVIIVADQAFSYEQDILVSRYANPTPATKTILFDDVVKSTVKLDQLGDERFRELLYQHNLLISDIIEQCCGGEIIKSTGDGLLMVFPDPASAVRCALKIQESFSKPDKQNQDTLQLRLGMDMGPVYEVGGGNTRDILGLHVNTASKITDLASAGHILAAESIYREASRILGSDILWKQLGTYQLDTHKAGIIVYEVYNKRTVPMTQLRNKHAVSNEV